ncbi:hypothetical protein BGZ94_005146, partial [Podila epigama]
MQSSLGPFDRADDKGTTTNSSTTTINDGPPLFPTTDKNDINSDHQLNQHHNGVNATFDDGVVMESGPRGILVVFGGFL